MKKIPNFSARFQRGIMRFGWEGLDIISVKTHVSALVMDIQTPADLPTDQITKITGTK